MKPLVRHARADSDVEEAVEYYLQHAPEVALKFIDALEETYRQIQQRPATGSPRYAHELNLQGCGSGHVNVFPTWFSTSRLRNRSMFGGCCMAAVIFPLGYKAITSL